MQFGERRYESLRNTYNEAVRRSAVTELVVKDGAMSVRVSTPQGVVKEIPAPFDPKGEIYVDYVLIDGRLLIRRVFDSTTPPAKALVIDPGLGTIDWDARGAAHGTCVYRRLGEGRWVVSVSGDGALGLTKSDSGPASLVNAPEIKSHEGIEAEAKDEIDRISAGDVWRWISGSTASR